jgi:hypothetical protein
MDLSLYVSHAISMSVSSPERKQLHTRRPISQARCDSEEAKTAGASPPASAKRLGNLLGRIGLAAVTAILSMNLWTGFPLLALWVGSHADGGQLLSMAGVAVAVIALVILLTVGVVVLTRVSATYDRLTGRPPPVRQPAPWLLSMNASKVQPARGRREINAIEAIVIAVVVAAFISFEIWLFFLSGSKLVG